MPLKYTKAIENIVTNPYRLRHQEKIMHFLDYYIDAEAIAMKVIAYYKRDSKKHIKAFDKIRTDTLIKAMNHFYLIFDSDDIYQIFSSYPTHKNTPTARTLRNHYMHGRGKTYAQSIINHYDFLTSSMQRFIKTIASLK